MWKVEDKIFLPNSKTEWLERIRYIKSVIKDIFNEFNLIEYVKEDIKLSDILTVDFYLEKFNLAIKINDLISRNSSKAFFDLTKITNKTPYKEWEESNKLGIRVINAYEHEIFDPLKWNIFKNMITYHCRISH
jgi:hypothetical protein